MDSAALDTRSQGSALDLSLFFSASPEAQGILNGDGFLEKVNDAFSTLLGFSIEELMARPLVAHLHEEDQKTTEEAFLGARIGDCPPCIENRLRRKDGSIVWFSWTYFRIEDRVFLSARDITAIKQGQSELLNSEQSLRFILENIPITMMVVDRDGRIELSMGRGLTKLGLAQNHNQGKCVFELYRDRPDVCKPLRTALAGVATHAKISVNGLDYDIFYEPILDRQGEVLKVIGVSMDTTYQRDRQLANSLPQIVWSARPDGVLDYFNDRWFEFLGLPKSAASAEEWEKQIHSDDVEHYQRAWRDGIKTEKPYEIEYRIMDRKTQEYRWFLGRAVPIFGDNGIIRWYGTCTDIHDQKLNSEKIQALLDKEKSSSKFKESLLVRLQEALKEASDIRFALDQSSIITTTDVEGKITYVNQKFIETSGFSAEEAIGSDHRIVNSNYHPREFFEDLWNTILSGKVWSGEIKNRSKSGIDYWVSTVIVPVLDSKKKPYQFIAIRNNISDRKNAEARLQAERTLFETTLQQLPFAVAIGEAPTGRIVFANARAEEIFKNPKSWKSVDDYAGRRAFHPDGTPYGIEDWPLAQAIKFGKTTRNQEALILSEEGGKEFLRMSAAPVLDPNGKIIAGVGVCEDRTALTQFEEEHSRLRLSERAAQEASRLKSQFLANMSHEIRTPLNGIAGMASLLLTTNLNKVQKEYTETLIQSSEHLQSLVNDVLDLAKIEANKLELDITEVDLRKLVEIIRRTMQHSVKAQKIRFKTRVISRQNLKFKGDFIRIKQVLLNLVHNAIKFTEKGSVELRVHFAELPSGKLKINFEVEDTGIGMSPEVLNSIFDPFVQADLSITRKYGGTGLGLSICRKLAKAMGGEITAVSKPKKGSIFTFEIPAKRSEVRPRALRTRVHPDQFKTNMPLRILVAEDNATNRKVIGRMLKLIGHKFDLAPDGIEVLKMLKKKSYDLVLMDCHMPKVDGFVATTRIRRIKGPLAKLPIIALTADAYKETLDKCSEIGMNGFVSKPINLAVLFNEIEKFATVPRRPRSRKVMDIKAIELLSLLNNPGDSDFVEEMIDSFFEKTPRKLTQIQQELKRGNLKEVFNQAHALKSVAASIGASLVESASADLEGAAQANEAQKLDSDFETLVSSFEATKDHVSEFRKHAKRIARRRIS